MAKTTAAGGKGGAGKSGRASRPPLPPQSGGKRVGAVRFFREAWAELRKVQWPTGPQVVQGTIVVAVFTIVFAIFLNIVDYGSVRLVRELDKLLT